jgi:hypothetical protein
LAAHSGEKHDWHNILGKNMIGITFWEKNMIGKTFLEKNMIGSTFLEKPRLSAQSGVKKNMNDSKFWEKT